MRSPKLSGNQRVWLFAITNPVTQREVISFLIINWTSLFDGEGERPAWKQITIPKLSI